MHVPSPPRGFRDHAEFVALARRRLDAMRARDPGFHTARAPHSFDTGQETLDYEDLHMLPVEWWWTSVKLTVAVAIIAIVALLTSSMGKVAGLVLLLAMLMLGSWIRMSHFVRRFRRAQSIWHREAEPMLGYLVAANPDLSEPGEPVVSAFMLVTGDAAAQREPGPCAAFGARFSEWLRLPEAEVPESARELMAWARAQDGIRLDRIAVPARLCGVRDAFAVSMLLMREDLPGGRLDRRFWPVWGRRDRRESMELVPLAAWHEPPDPRAAEGDPMTAKETGTVGRFDDRCVPQRLAFPWLPKWLIDAAALFSIVSVVVFAGLATLAFAVQENPGYGWWFALLATGSFAELLILPRIRRAGFEADRQGFTVTSSFARRSYAWDAVESLRVGWINEHRIYVRDGGGIRKVVVRAMPASCEQFLGMAIAHVPALRIVAWGIGFPPTSGTERDGGPAEVEGPREVCKTLLGIRILGPGANDLFFLADEPGFEAIQVAVDTRLLPWMEARRWRSGGSERPPAASRGARG